VCSPLGANSCCKNWCLVSEHSLSTEKQLISALTRQVVRRQTYSSLCLAHVLRVKVIISKEFRARLNLRDRLRCSSDKMGRWWSRFQALARLQPVAFKNRGTVTLIPVEKIPKTFSSLNQIKNYHRTEGWARTVCMYVHKRLNSNVTRITSSSSKRLSCVGRQCSKKTGNSFLHKNEFAQIRHLRNHLTYLISFAKFCNYLTYVETPHEEQGKCQTAFLHELYINDKKCLYVKL
jgi:hypothetical protein